MLNKFARGFFTRLLTPLAKVLLRLGVTPDAVTIVGTAGVAFGALVFFTQGQLFVGTLIITVFVFSDLVDGIMARQAQRPGLWGNFLDSTLDRIADGAIFGSICFWFFTGGKEPWLGAAALVCLVTGMLVSYARAKAESLGFDCKVGIAERAERLVAVLVMAGLTGLGLPPMAFLVVMLLLAAASLVTLVQRILTVRTQALAATA